MNARNAKLSLNPKKDIAVFFVLTDRFPVRQSRMGIKATVAGDDPAPSLIFLPAAGTNIVVIMICENLHFI
jgi:hypothetical protein